ncbi:Phosphopantetheine attachment site [Paenibacillus uliginis N3/975]|uniref:Phosphopantetheine attachment site n=1 Tax=Paenibacillus uliginis N3/975 TaxID=1313296 RepID=A0A1X7GZQ1_9BACL|nr:acyl carrier protein [Paenibacillus uliginis]SMF77032.1 Phosphopantetheine attachment site [Paenibacillus uliginis N3/975]
MHSLEKSITKIVLDVLEFHEEEIGIHDCLENYGMDSIKFIMISVQIENMLDISIADEKLLLDNFSTLESIINLVKESKKN